MRIQVTKMIRIHNTDTMIGKIPVSMAQQSINGSSSYLKCPLAGAELVHDAAEGPHVRLGVVGPALTQLCKMAQL
jgi:hypothetical protein